MAFTLISIGIYCISKFVNKSLEVCPSCEKKPLWWLLEADLQEQGCEQGREQGREQSREQGREQAGRPLNFLW